jgi:hypothetical protein
VDRDADARLIDEALAVDDARARACRDFLSALAVIFGVGALALLESPGNRTLEESKRAAADAPWPQR